ncbi:MAG TPA: YHS domain-containing protein [Gemmataceae bacterium]|nr:YHS domain-containing protein [Gemmataceae bacterium]
MKVRVASICLLGLFAATASPADKSEQAKEALKALNDFVGQWKGSGETKSGKSELWKETAEWAWDLKGAEPSLKFKVEGGKQFSEGTLTYLPDKKKYQLTAKTADKKEQVYAGEIKAKRLVLTYDDADTKDRYTVEMSTNNDGARFVYNVAVQKKGVGLSRKLVEVGLSKEGAALAGGKKNECIITGGLGTIAVSYSGKTYYFCCTGCRDEFMANPKKYVEEYEKSKK